jgi:hypothetical protein
LATGSFEYGTLCLPTGCYDLVVGGGSYDSEISFDFDTSLVTASAGSYYVSVGGATCILGCTDATALNYDPLATSDDGSCNYCTDNSVLYTAGGYASENSFTITDCDGDTIANMTSGLIGYDSCIVLPAVYSVNLYDSYGDGWNGGTVTIDGVVYTQSYTGFGNPNDESFQVGVCPVLGCTDSTAANYNALADTDDNSCTYGIAGCDDVLACNYDANATANDGSCTYAAAPLDCAGNCANGGDVFNFESC